MTAGLRSDGLSRALLCFEGDSNTDPSRPTNSADGWVAQLMALTTSTHPGATNGGNLAVSGNQWPNATSRQAAFDALATEDGTSRLNVSLYMMGTNDINTTAVTGAGAGARARAYFAAAASVWQHRVAMQVPYNGNSGALDAEVDAYNADCVQMVIDGVVDSCFVRPAILNGVDTDQYSDAVHLSQPLGLGNLALHLYQHLKVNL